ncbi:uncharacterized protein LOC143255031 isoform X1 [Tachypleus tridentatus]|uniref:uncharacterized protein LOC143255031 isoform X1 n=1 Tax=Tachypleus tridentatus TaxID=6853 RepID=UPI003FD08B2F
MDWVRLVIKREVPILSPKIPGRQQVGSKKSERIGMENSNKESCLSFTSIFSWTTVVITAAATVCLSVALLTNHWETVTFRRSQVRHAANNSQHTVMWVSSHVARVKAAHPSAPRDVEKIASYYNQHGWNFSSDGHIYLVPLQGGVYSICTDLSEEDRTRLSSDGFSPPMCVSYLTPQGMVFRNTWLSRMRNLGMSCAMVSLILLGASAVVGSFGLVKRQISAVMVTGVMFFLAALFGLFTLAFMYFKRVKPEGVYTSTIMDKGLPITYLRTREFTMGWSASLGWGGVMLCIISSIFWLLLARVLRYQVVTLT